MTDRYPLVSILIPTYNQSLFIEEAVHSALSLTYKNLEVIVSDDNSSDGTLDRIRCISSPSLHVFQNKINLGRVSNYRLLLNSYSRGKYILFLDGDDWLADTTFFDQAVLIMEDNQSVSAVSGLTSLVSPNGVYETTVNPITEYPNGSDLLISLPFHQSFLSHSATLYRRDQAIRSSFYSLDVRSSDWDSLYRLCHQGTISYLNTLVSFWRLTSNNASLNFTAYESIANLAIWDRIYNLELCATPLVLILFLGAKNLCRARAIYNDIWLSLKQGGFSISFFYLASVLKAYPVGVCALPCWVALRFFFVCIKYLKRVCFRSEVQVCRRQLLR